VRVLRSNCRCGDLIPNAGGGFGNFRSSGLGWVIRFFELLASKIGPVYP
jgi:hypothetical protein